GDDRDDRAPGHGFSERRTDRFGAEVAGFEAFAEDLFDLLDSFGAQRFGRDLVTGAADVLTFDLLYVRVALAHRAHHASQLALGYRLDERGLDARPRAEVDAEVEPLAPDRDGAHEQDRARQREEPPGGAHEVEAPARPPLARAQRRGPRDDPRAAHRPQRRLSGEDGGEQRDQRAYAEREGEALDFGGGEREQDERRHERDDVGVH